MIVAISAWRTIVLDLQTDLFVPQLVTWDPETGEFSRRRGSAGLRDVGRGGGGGEVS